MITNCEAPDRTTGTYAASGGFTGRATDDSVQLPVPDKVSKDGNEIIYKRRSMLCAWSARKMAHGALSRG